MLAGLVDLHTQGWTDRDDPAQVHERALLLGARQ
jgi:hypothetical protein